jgi:hypothetical protein
MSSHEVLKPTVGTPVDTGPGAAAVLESDCVGREHDEPSPGERRTERLKWLAR